MESSSFLNADLLNNLSQQAIQAAIKGQWQNAVDINSEILNKSPKDIEVPVWFEPKSDAVFSDELSSDSIIFFSVLSVISSDF